MPESRRGLRPADRVAFTAGNGIPGLPPRAGDRVPTSGGLTSPRDACACAPIFQGRSQFGPPHGPNMHRYRSHTCGALRDTHIGETVRLSGWVHRMRDHGGVLFIDLRDHYGITQVVADPDSPAFKDAEKLHAEWVITVDGKVRRRPGGTENPTCRPARSRSTSRIEVLGPAAELPMPVFGDQEYPEEIRLKYRFLDLRRERLHRNIIKRGQIIELDPPPHEGAGLLRIPDADPDRLVAGGRARLPGAVAAASGQVLRAAAGAAAVQAAHHGGGLRPLFPDRAVLPRRGRARRPLARRVLSARRRDELRHAGRRVRRDRAGDARHVRGVRRRQAGDAEVSAASRSPTALQQIRHRQAGPAQSDRDAGRLGDLPRLRLQGVRAHPRERTPKNQRVGDPGAGRRLARVLRPDEFLGAGRGAAGARLHLLCRGGGQDARPRPGRQQCRAGAHRAAARAARPEGRRRGVLRRGRAGEVRASSPVPRAPRSARTST